MKVVLEDPSVLGDGKKLEVVVDADVAAFNDWFLQQQRDGGTSSPQALTPSERAILKTYLWWKTKGARDGA